MRFLWVIVASVACSDKAPERPSEIRAHAHAGSDPELVAKAITIRRQINNCGPGVTVDIDGTYELAAGTSATWKKLAKQLEQAVEDEATYYTTACADELVEIDGKLVRSRKYHPDGTVWLEKDEVTEYEVVTRSAKPTNQSWFPSDDEQAWRATRTGSGATWALFDRAGKPR